MKNCIGKELSKIPMPVRFLHIWACPESLSGLVGLSGKSAAVTVPRT